MRFDFTGLGGSEGEFANTHFSSNVEDLIAAADHLRKTYGAPAILIGHSLGGAAVLAAAHRSARRARGGHHRRAVRSRPCRRSVQGQGRRRSVNRARSRCSLPGGRSASSANFSTMSPKRGCRKASPILRKALLMFHSPTDDPGRHRQRHAYFRHGQASEKLRLARRRRPSAEPRRATPSTSPMSSPHGSSAISMRREHDGGRSRERPRAGARDARRQIPAGNLERAAPHARRRAGQAGRARLRTGALRFSAGGPGRLHFDDGQALRRLQEDPAGECVGAALATARSTPRIARPATPRSATVDRIDRAITLEGPLDADQRKRLMEIADKCPVHKTLEIEDRHPHRRAAGLTFHRHRTGVLNLPPCKPPRMR